MRPAGPAYRELVREIGRPTASSGSAGPRSTAGQGFSALEQYLFYDEANRAGVPLPLVTLNTVGPDAQRFGSDAQKQQFLPAIVAGEVHFAIGYSEPGAGHRPRRRSSHPRGARRRRVRDQRPEDLDDRRPRRRLGVARVSDRSRRAEAQGDLDHPRAHVVTRASRTRRSGCSAAATRTRPSTTTCGSRSTTSCSGENQGWKLITSQLNHERVALAPAGRLERPLQPGAGVGAGHHPGRRDAPDRPRVGAASRSPASTPSVEALKLANWRVAADARCRRAAPGRRVGHEGARERAAVAVPRPAHGGRRCVRLPRSRAPPGPRLRLSLEQAYRSAVTITFGGGVNEVQREIIGMTGLGLPPR